MLLPSAAARYSTWRPRPSSSYSRILASFTSRSHSGYDSKSTATSKQRSAGASTRMRSLAVSVIGHLRAAGGPWSRRGSRRPGRERPVARGPQASEREREHRDEHGERVRPRRREREDDGHGERGEQRPADVARRRPWRKNSAPTADVVAAGRADERDAERVHPDDERGEEQRERDADRHVVEGAAARRRRGRSWPRTGRASPTTRRRSSGPSRRRPLCGCAAGPLATLMLTFTCSLLQVPSSGVAREATGRGGRWPRGRPARRARAARRDGRTRTRRRPVGARPRPCAPAAPRRRAGGVIAARTASTSCGSTT